ncbi:MAG TPA: DUF2254 domain-containing protein [Dongiaceae bacterium]
MRWSQWYSLRSYVRSALWVIPFFALLLHIVTIRAVFAIDAWLGWEPPWPWGVSGTQMLLQTIISMTLTFIVFTFGSLLVAIQIAGGQLTPRIIAATLLRNNVIRVIVGLFIFTLLFATGALARLEGTAYNLVAEVAGVLGFASVAAFLYLIDYAARLLRPVSIVWQVGEAGIEVIEDVYPEPAVEAAALRPPVTLPACSKTVLHRGKSGIVLAVNVKALVEDARRSSGMIEFVPRVGDFVGVGEPLFHLYDGASAIEEGRLRNAVAFGPERTIEQDSTFAFRIIVDIAIKALSKAINDPTTAVLAIDQLQRLLRSVGKRKLHTDEIVDAAGEVRLILRTPNWRDFVHLTFSEIRFYGAENVQIARRLRAMIENLVQTLPDYRHAALRTELTLLDRSLEKLYILPEDLKRARVPDAQGLGGASRR